MLCCLQCVATAACCLSCELRCAWHCPHEALPAPTAGQQPPALPPSPPPPRPPAPPYSFMPLSADQRRRADELVTVFENSSLEPKCELVGTCCCLFAKLWQHTSARGPALPLRTSWAAAEPVLRVGQLTWRFLSCCVCRQLCSGPGRWARHHLWKVLPCSHHHRIMPLRSSHATILL